VGCKLYGITAPITHARTASLRRVHAIRAISRSSLPLEVFATPCDLAVHGIGRWVLVAPREHDPPPMVVDQAVALGPGSHLRHASPIKGLSDQPVHARGALVANRFPGLIAAAGEVGVDQACQLRGDGRLPSPIAGREPQRVGVAPRECRQGAARLFVPTTVRELEHLGRPGFGRTRSCGWGDRTRRDRGDEQEREQSDQRCRSCRHGRTVSRAGRRCKEPEGGFGITRPRLLLSPRNLEGAPLGGARPSHPGFAPGRAEVAFVP
jgi:hypothetical protein